MSQLTESWKALNKRHNEINRFFYQTYGGPDVGESYFSEKPVEIAQQSRELFTERITVSDQKKALEDQMTEEEFNECYSV